MPSRFAKMVKSNQVSASRHISPFGQISSIIPGGKNINVQNVVKGEARELRNVQPYGVSSCGLTGLYIQTAITDNNNNVAVGVYDPKKPYSIPGEIIIYSVAGTTVRLGADNTITANAPGVGTLSMGAPKEGAAEGEAGVRLNCELGESQLVLDEAGNIELSNPVASIKISSGGEIEITSPSTITVNVGGDVTVTGGDVISDGISLKNHTHDCPVDSSPTSPPK